MKTTRNGVVATLCALANVATCALPGTVSAAAKAPYDMYEIQATSSITVRLPVPPGKTRILYLAKNRTWADAAFEREGQACVITLSPSHLTDGATTLLVNPPPDLNCNDRTAPDVTGITVDGKRLEPGDTADLGAIGELPSAVTVTFRDAGSPLVAESLQAALDGAPVGPDNLETSVAKGQATATIRVPEVGFGKHTLTVAVADQSPFRNETEFALSFTYADTKNVAQAALGAEVKVDSCFPNYTAAPLIDGDSKSGAGSGGHAVTWASAETETDHWIEVVLPKPESIGSVALYWAYKKPSKRVEVQAWQTGKWERVAAFDRTKTEEACTLIRFKPVTTDRIRVFQPGGHGRDDRPNLFWLGEIAVRKAD